MTPANAQRESNSKSPLQLSEAVILQELVWIKANERCQVYEPNAPVAQLIEMVGTKPNLLYILSAANGIGKTTALVNLACNIFFGPQNRFFDYPIFKDWPHPKRIRFVSEVSQVKDGGPFPTEIAKWWPRGRYTAGRNGQGYNAIYETGEWALEVMTYDQLPKQHEGANLGMVLFNEPPPQNLYTPNISRLRDGGICVIGMTPLTDAGWFFDAVVPRHNQFVVYADVETACKQHGTRGHLDHDQIQKMIAEYTPEEREARIDGKAMYLQGRIFKTFTPNVHVLKEPFTPTLGSTIYNVVDPHTDKPFFALWACPQKNGDVIIFDEHPNEDFFKMHNCQWVLEDYKRMYYAKEHGYQVKRVIDRHFAEIRSTATKRNLKEELEAIGMHYESSYTATEEIDTGILKVREYLKYNAAKPIDSLNKPKLYINPHCHNTIKAFQYWSLDPKTGKYQDAYKDPMDTVRYLLMANPHQSEPMPYKPPVKRYG